MPQSEATTPIAAYAQPVTAEDLLSTSVPSSANNRAHNSVTTAQHPATIAAHDTAQHNIAKSQHLTTAAAPDTASVSENEDASSSAEPPAVNGTPTKWIFGFGSLIHNPGASQHAFAAPLL